MLNLWCTYIMQYCLAVKRNEVIIDVVPYSPFFLRSLFILQRLESLKRHFQDSLAFRILDAKQILPARCTCMKLEREKQVRCLLAKMRCALGIHKVIKGHGDISFLAAAFYFLFSSFLGSKKQFQSRQRPDQLMGVRWLQQYHCCQCLSDP